MDISRLIELSIMLLSGLAALLLSMFVHELGHFWCARVANIRVHEVSLGVGRVIFSRWWGVTRWTLRAIPIAAFVMPASKGATTNDKDLLAGPPLGVYSDAYDYALASTGTEHASFLGRLCFVLGGPFANFAFAWVLCVALLMLPSEWAVSSAGTQISTNTGFKIVWSEDEVVARATSYRISVQSTSNEGEQGPLPGDEILEVNGLPVQSITGIYDLINETPESNIELLITRDNALKIVVLDVQDKINATGVATMSLNSIEAATATTFCGFIILTAVPDLMSHQLGHMASEPIDSAAQAGSVIHIVPELGHAIRDSIRSGLNSLVNVNVALGIINLLPLPILDGGKAVGMMIELLTPKYLRNKRLTVRGFEEATKDDMSFVSIATLALSLLLIGWMLLVLCFDVIEVLS